MKTPIKINILSLIIAVLLIVTTIFTFKYFKERKKRVTWNNNYLAVIDTLSTYKTKTGLMAARTRNLNFTVKELSGAINKKDSLIESLKFIIEDQDAKIRRLDNIIITQIESTGSGSGEESIDTILIVEDNNVDCHAFNIDDSYLYEDVVYCDDGSFEYYYRYKEDIYIVTEMMRKPNKKGKPVFILWRWLRPWIDKTTITPSNPNSKINIATKVNVVK